MLNGFFTINPFISNKSIELDLRKVMVGSTNSSRSGIGSRCSSRFRGVLPLENHKWGARISFKYKTHWLGTYRMEEEAAIAYDRAALKLQKRDSPLNFPWKIHTAQEKLFHSRYSNEEILSMIKDKTYSSNFTRFLARQSLDRRSISGSLANATGISFELLFQKKLTQTDVTHFKGFHIPKQYALQYLPAVGNSSVDVGRMGTGPIELTFYDKYCRSWSFLYSYWSSTKTFLFTKGWGHFVTMNNLNPGDILKFYGCYYAGQAGERRFYMIDVHRNVAANCTVGSGAGQGIGAYVNRVRGVEQSTGVKLFGVKIS